MKNRSFIFIITSLIIISWYSVCFSLEEKTHEAINQYIVQNAVNGFSLNSYLINNLGFKDGFKESLKGIDANGNEVYKKIFEWLGYGGIYEDRPGSIKDYILNKPTRSVNHFHNPLKHWSEAGLNDILGFYTGQSSVLWSQNQNQYIGGKWSWSDARNYFYKALTDGSKNEREINFANTFRSVGQLMHLIQDASVPEHVRNDAHVLPAYEAYVENIRNKNSALWANWIGNTPFDKLILDVPTISLAPVPISRIIDTDLYNSKNPEITLNSRIGLAEYTNANFLSPDTMFTDDLNHDHRHYFPYPRGRSASLWIDTTNILPRLYLKKTTEGEAINHLAVVSFLYNYRSRYFPQYFLNLPVGLDDKVYEEYVSKLIPRAVGYSAGLLNYFFRGEIEAVNPEAIKDSSGNITGIKLKVKNKTPDEAMGSAEKPGELVISYKYKLSGSEVYGTSDEVSLNESISSGSESTTEFAFNFTPSIPLNAQETKYWLVYSGKLGNEEDAVMGKRIGTSGIFLIKYSETEDRLKQLFFEVDIVDGQYKITPIKYEVPLVGFSDTCNTWTVVSNPDNTEHWVTFPEAGTDYKDYLLWYGLMSPPGDNRCYGTNYIWRPTKFAGELKEGENSEYVLVDQQKNWRDSDGNYNIVALGRHNYTLDSEGKMISYLDSVWVDNYGNCVYRHIGESSQGFVNVGDVGCGQSLVIDSFSGQNIIKGRATGKMAETLTLEGDQIIEENIIAVLGKGKIIKIQPKTITPFSYSLQDPIELARFNFQGKIRHSGADDYCLLEDGEGIFSATPAKIEDESTVTLLVSEQELDYLTNFSEILFYPTYSVIQELKFVESCPYTGDESFTPQYVPVSFPELTGREAKGSITVHDYDNMDGDGTYILLYSKEVTQVDYTQSATFIFEPRAMNLIYVWGNGEWLNWSYFDDMGTDNFRIIDQEHHQSKNQLFLIYKIRDDFKRIILQEENQSVFEIRDEGFLCYPSPCPAPIGPPSGPPENKYYPHIFTGFSTQINKDMMVYTYLIEKWNGSEYIFDKRMIGIINISDEKLPVGYRQEFVINSGDFSIDGFDYTQIGGIGIHKSQ